jgi:hypothetical protein
LRGARPVRASGRRKRPSEKDGTAPPADSHHATKADVTIAEDGTATIKTRWGQTYTTNPEPVEEPPF